MGVRIGRSPPLSRLSCERAPLIVGRPGVGGPAPEGCEEWLRIGSPWVHLRLLRARARDRASGRALIPARRELALVLRRRAVRLNASKSRSSLLTQLGERCSICSTASDVSAVARSGSSANLGEQVLDLLARDRPSLRSMALS